METGSKNISDVRGVPDVRLSIGTKLTITFLVLAIIPMSAVAFYNLTQSRNEVSKLAMSELISLSHSTANSIEQVLIENQLNSAMLAGDPLTKQFITASEKDRRTLSPKIYKMLENFVDTHPDYDSPGLLDANGIVVAALEERLVGKDRSFRDYFQASIKGKPYISDILVGRATKRPGVFLTNPVISAEGKIAGIVLLWLKADTIWNIIDDVKVGKEGIAYLIDQDGVIIAHPGRELLYHSLGKLSSETISTISSTIRFGTIKGTKKPVIPKNLGIEKLAAQIASAQGPRTYYYFSPLKHRNHVVGYSPLKKQPWTVVVDLPEVQFMAPLNRMRTVAYVSIGLVAVITIIISLLLAKSITRPIRRLTEVSVDVKHDRPFNPSNIEDVTTGHDEIAHLGRMFSGMVLSLRESEERMRSVLETSPVGISIYDDTGQCFIANDSIAKMIGATKEQVLQQNYNNIESWKISGALDKAKSAIKENISKRHEFIGESSFGQMVQLDCYFVPFSSGRLLFMTHDITERKRSEEALQTSHERFLTVLDSIDATIYVADMETYEIIFMNKNMIESFGGDMTGEICFEVFRGESGPCQHCTNDQLIDENGKPTDVLVWQGKNPINEKWYINYDRAIEWTDGRLVKLQIATDITTIKMMEQQLQQTEKFKSIGTLAGGIAHDFNNLLMGIQGRISLLSVDLEPSNSNLEHINAIEDYIRSATDLTRQLLGFARGGKYEVKPTNINELVSKGATMFGRTKKEIRIHTNLQNPSPVVAVDRGQIEQVMLNLYVNAWQAMPDAGELYIETKTITLDETYCKPYQTKPGRYAKVSVTDTGIGMNA